MRQSLFAGVILFVMAASAAAGMMFPRQFTVLGGEGVQEFTLSHALEHLDRALYAQPLGGDVIRVNEVTEMSIVADAGFDKIVYTLESVDSTGLRTNEGTWVYGYSGTSGSPGFFNGPRAIAVDQDPVELPGGVLRYVVYVADTGNARIAVLNLDYGDSITVSHVDYWESDHLAQPYDLDFEETKGLLYVIDYETGKVVVFDRQGMNVDYYGGVGTGTERFKWPRGIACSYDGFWLHVFVADTGNQRIVHLKGLPLTPPAHELVYEGEYGEPRFFPMSLAAAEGSGLYALVWCEDGRGIISLDSSISQRLGRFGFEESDGHVFTDPVYIKMRDGEIGITDHYCLTSGLSYWVLDAQILNASVTPDPFDPIESYCLISYALTAHGDVTVEVFDSDWEPVETLVDDELKCCGYHHELWDGSGQLPGLYHVLLTCEDYGGDGTPDLDTLDVSIGGIPLEVFDVFPSYMPVATPAWSNAGDKIAFAVTGSSYPQYDGIYVLDLSDSSWTQLTQPSGSVYDSHPDWSPSDEYIVFQRTPGPGSLTDQEDQYTEIKGAQTESPMDLRTSWVYKISSSGPLGSEAMVAGDCYWYPVWSPYLTNEGGQVPKDGGRIASWKYDDHQLWTFKAMDGTDHRMVTPGTDSIGGDPLLDKAMSSWSPEGRAIGFNTFPGELALWTIDVETGTYSLVLREESTADLRDLRWSPSGSPLAYEVYDLDALVTGVRTISVKGDYEQTYVVNHDWGEGFDWSPDGTKIVFVKSDLGGRCLAIVDSRRDESAIPAANIAWPVSGQILPRADYQFIVGTAYDNVGVDDQILATYQSHILEWGRGRDPLVWETDFLYTMSKKEYGNIGYWDTSNPDYFEEGVEYTLRLSVTDGVHTGVEKVYVTICDSSSAMIQERDVPLEFEISAPSPNPTLGGAMVRLGLPKETVIRVSVYSCEGRLVKEVMNTGLPAGYHKVEWDGRDAGGRPCASGIYWCIIDTGAVSKPMKVVLLK